ncbi:MAG: hypothetical protein WAN65_08400, partial [Candidatus Sulfotelmatobacter sp.]
FAAKEYCWQSGLLEAGRKKTRQRTKAWPPTQCRLPHGRRLEKSGKIESLVFCRGFSTAEQKEML